MPASWMKALSSNGVCEPITRGTRRLVGIELNKARNRSVVDALVGLATEPDGFTLAQLAETFRQRTGWKADTYSTRHAAYDLAKLHGKHSWFNAAPVRGAMKPNRAGCVRCALTCCCVTKSSNRCWRVSFDPACRLQTHSPRWISITSCSAKNSSVPSQRSAWQREAKQTTTCWMCLSHSAYTASSRWWMRNGEAHCARRCSDEQRVPALIPEKETGIPSSARTPA